MRLALSTLAIGHPLDDCALASLAVLGISGLELAPLTQWGDWTSATPKDAIAFRHAAARHGLQIPAMQGIVFRAIDVGWVELDAGRAMAEHFERVAELAIALGAKVAVLGAPAMRKRQGLTKESAEAKAVESLALAVRPFEVRGLTLGIETVPKSAGCELGCSASECADLVRRVASPALRLHLDSAALAEAGEDIARGWPEWGDLVCHVHLSEPNLGPLKGGTIPHVQNIKKLRQLHYNGWVTVEMLRPSGSLEDVVDWEALCAAAFH